MVEICKFLGLAALIILLLLIILTIIESFISNLIYGKKKNDLKDVIYKSICDELDKNKKDSN